jgi:hypothetical protein
MDSAKEQAAMANGWANATAVATGSSQETNVLSYVKNNTLPTCPANGVYTWGNIGTDPTCNLSGDGHTL